MSQISPPVRILLIGAVVFLAAWFTILKPKPAEIEPLTTTNPPTRTTGPGKAVDKAEAAAGLKTESAPTDTAPATTTAPDAKPETTTPVAIPAEALAKLPKDVARALEARKVLVLGVFADDAKAWRPMSDDDRYVRNALRRANRYDGAVFVKHVGITKLSTYGPLVNDLHVSQSPAIVVIDGNLEGTVLTGYVDRISINQVIADARDASTDPDIADAYLRSANKLCARYETRMTRWSAPTIPGVKAGSASLARLVEVVANYRHGIARLKAPAKWRGLETHWVRVMTMRETTLRDFAKAWKGGDTSGLYAAVGAFDSRDVRKLDGRFNAAGLTNCAINRRA